MKRETYLSELTAQLQRRGIDDKRIGEIIAEVESHLNESSENPIVAFGPADLYAEKMAEYEETQTVDEQTSGIQWHNRTFRATAFDEMETLDWAGREGWELVDVGALALFCRRPKDLNQAHHWEYKRRTGTHHIIIGQEMADAQWEPCGNWMVFHYFKRKVRKLQNS